MSSSSKAFFCCGRNRAPQSSLPGAPQSSLPSAGRWTWDDHFSVDGFSWDDHYLSDVVRGGKNSRESSRSVRDGKNSRESSRSSRLSSPLTRRHDWHMSPRSHDWHASPRRSSFDSPLSSASVRSSNESHSSSGASFVNQLHDGITSAIGSAVTSFDSKDTDKEVTDKNQLLQDMLFAARKLEGPVQKYPKSGRGLFKSTQERYLAAIPKERTPSESDCHPSHTADERLKHELDCWKDGTLSYWESCADYMAKEIPKGSVPLLQIVEVHYAEDVQGGCGVVVKHMQGGETNELVLLFPNKMLAVKWINTLWDLLSKLRRVHGIE
mmetsp:Transcript_90013/g.155937  ORF Transcript_90013/g.155937 Transcript_90013/m.155937 type:complete len:324 (-) Transcript_90013:8-979(-)